MTFITVCCIFFRLMNQLQKTTRVKSGLSRRITLCHFILFRSIPRRRGFESGTYSASFICPDNVSRSVQISVIKHGLHHVWEKHIHPIVHFNPRCSFLNTPLLSLLFNKCTWDPICRQQHRCLIAMHGPQHYRVPYHKLVWSVLYR